MIIIYKLCFFSPVTDLADYIGTNSIKGTAFSKKIEFKKLEIGTLPRVLSG